MNLVVMPSGAAEWGERRFRRALGRGGITADKREGDGATPAGTLALTRVLYRPDRVARPETELPCAALRPEDGWCDAPNDPAYNQPVRLSHGASAETLWRDDHVYDLVVITDHNAGPVVPGLGSAIFVHVAKPDFAPTEGCIAFSLEDLRLIVGEWRPNDRFDVRAG